MGGEHLGGLDTVPDPDLLEHEVNRLAGHGSVLALSDEDEGILGRAAKTLAAGGGDLLEGRAHPEFPSLPRLPLLDRKVIGEQVPPPEGEEVGDPEPEVTPGGDEQAIPEMSVFEEPVDEPHRLVPVHRLGGVMPTSVACRFSHIQMF